MQQYHRPLFYMRTQDEGKPYREQERSVEQRGQGSSTHTQEGFVYRAVVEAAHHGKGVMRVKLDINGEVINNCVWADGPMAGLLGIKVNYTPPPGSVVLVVKSGESTYAMSGVPSSAPDANSHNTRTIAGLGFKTSDLSTYKEVGKEFSTFAPGSTSHNDTIEGEYTIGNDLGVMLGLLTGIAKLQAGDRAKIETCLLNNMVRVVSDNFKHISAFGDMEIYNNGRLNVMWDGTSYEHEAWGLKTPTDPKAPSIEGEVDFSSMDHVTETGRWRFSKYIGFLGDFINEIVSDPSKAVGDYAKLSAEALRSGKARTHIGSDGSILWQTVAEFAVEKVTRIIVPIPVKRWEEGLKKKEFDSLEGKYLKLWDDYDDTSKLINASYQLREYARWLNQYHSYARFLQMEEKGIWKVPSEEETPEPDINCEEEDRENSNTGIGYIETYSTFRIMRDGSHLFLDSYGNFTVTGDNGIQYGTPKHYEVNVGGDIIFNAGQNIRFKARRSIDLVAISGGIKIKSRAFLHALCEWGSIWLKSDAVDPENEEAPKAEDPDQDPAPEVLPAAIMFETTKGRTYLRSERRAVIETRAEDEDLILQSVAAGLTIRAGNEYIEVDAEDGVSIKSKKTLVYSPTVTFSSQSFIVGDGFTVKGGCTNIDKLQTNSVASKGSIQGPKIPGPSLGLSQHFNHITEVSEEWEGPVFESAAEALELLTEVPPLATTDPGAKWDFGDRDEYMWDGRDLYEPLSQQFVRNDEPLPSGEDNLSNFKTWSYSSDQLKEAPNNGRNLPWPGRGGDRAYTYTGGDSLFKPSSKAPKELKTKATGFSLQPIIHRFFKKQ